MAAGLANMTRQEPDLSKRKVTSLLLEISKQEKHYLEVMHDTTDKYMGVDVNPPHLLNIAVLNEGYIPLWYTIEPWMGDCELGVQGWDVQRDIFRSFKWPMIVDGSLNSQVYEPVAEPEWERRQKLTNLLYQEEYFITQTKAKYR